MKRLFIYSINGKKVKNYSYESARLESPTSVSSRINYISRCPEVPTVLPVRLLSSPGRNAVKLFFLPIRRRVRKREKKKKDG